MSSDGGSFGRMGVHVGADWMVLCSTYPDHTPILTINAASTAVAFMIAGSDADARAVEFARELVCRVGQFAAEVERLNAAQKTAAQDKAADEAV